MCVALYKQEVCLMLVAALHRHELCLMFFTALYGYALCLVFFIALVFNVTVVRCTLWTRVVFSVFHCTCV